MSDHAAFYAAILADPQSDTPRLVYADWLQENGEPHRADFIRSHIRLVRMSPRDPEYPALRRHVVHTFDQHGWPWVAPAFGPLGDKQPAGPGWLKANRQLDPYPESRNQAMTPRGTFSIIRHPTHEMPVTLTPSAFWCRLEVERGMPVAVGVQLWFDDRSRLEVILACGPVSRLVVRNAFVSSEPEWAELTCPGLQQIRDLDATDSYGLSLGIFDDAIFVNVTRLTIGGYHPVSEHRANQVRRFVRSPMAKRLTRLTLGLSDEALRELAHYPLDDRLQELVCCAGFSPTDWGLLSGVAFRPTLRRLTLQQCRVDDSQLARIARTEKWLRLTHFSLVNNRIQDTGLHDFGRSGLMPQLRHLNLSQNLITDAGIDALSKSSLFGQLETLDLRRNRITGRGAVRLADAARSGHIRRLLLGHNRLTEADAKAVRQRLGERVSFRG